MLLPPPAPPLFPYTTLFRSFPFADAPHTEAEMKAHYAEIGEKVGRLPWLIEQSYERLVEAFKARDKNRILRSEEHTSELQSLTNLVCRLLLEKKREGQQNAV